MRTQDAFKAENNDESSVISNDDLAKLHQVFLIMIDDIARICEEHGLTYIFIGGSAIGAVREHGFIPWDDDVDIAMPRKDYEQFKKVIAESFNEKYLVSDPSDNVNWCRVIPALRLRGTVFDVVYDYVKVDPCISIDIFIIENTFNNPILRFAHGVGCYCWGFLNSCRTHYENRKNIRSRTNDMKFRLKFEFRNIFGFCSSFVPVEKVAKRTDAWYALCKDDSSRLVTLPSDVPRFFRGLTPRENLCEVVEAEFEGRLVNLPRNYDHYLRGIYGDYMQVPPEDKRIMHVCPKLDFGPYDSVSPQRDAGATSEAR